MKSLSKNIQACDGAECKTAPLAVILDALRYVFVDVEVGWQDKKIHDIGALRWDGAVFHSANIGELLDFIKDVNFVCGHNVINHDAKYLFGEEVQRYEIVDALFMSPLLFPERPYHHLLKDDKLISEQINNPVNDCEKARDLLMDEIARWNRLSASAQLIISTLLHDCKEFRGFFAFVGAEAGVKESLTELICSEYAGRICVHAKIEGSADRNPRELAYALADAIIAYYLIVR